MRGLWLGTTGGKNTRKQQYRCISIDSIEYKAHLLAYLYMTGEWPGKLIDHKDGNGLNNKWGNLREATSSQNIFALHNLRKNRAAAVSGVSFSKYKQRFRAYITVNGRQNHLGYFDKLDDAVLARKNAAKRLYGEFAA